MLRITNSKKWNTPNRKPIKRRLLPSTAPDSDVWQGVRSCETWLGGVFLAVVAIGHNPETKKLTFLADYIRIRGCKTVALRKRAIID